MKDLVKKYANRPVMVLGVALAGALVIVGCGGGDDNAPVYEGERIEVVNPFSIDGSTGSWLAFVLPYLQEYTPGMPTIEQVSRSGGGGTTGPNFFERNTASDGSFLLASSGSSVFPYIFNQEAVEYDFADYTAILASPLGGIVYVRKDTNIATVADFCDATGLTHNAVNVTGLDAGPLFGISLLDGIELGFNDRTADVNVVQNSTSRGTARTDFLNGEINLSFDSLVTEIDAVRDDANLLFSVGIVEDGELARDPTFPDLPHFGEVYMECNGSELSGVEKEAYLALVIGGFAAQKVIWAKNDVPQENIDALLEGARGAVADSDFQADKLVKVGEYDFAVGQDAQDLFAATSNLSDEAYNFLRTRLNETFPNAQIPARP